MKHKLLSILLCLAMALSLLPTAALAEGTGTPENYVTLELTYGSSVTEESIAAAKAMYEGKTYDTCKAANEAYMALYGVTWEKGYLDVTNNAAPLHSYAANADAVTEVKFYIHGTLAGFTSLQSSGNQIDCTVGGNHQIPRTSISIIGVDGSDGSKAKLTNGNVQAYVAGGYDSMFRSSGKLTIENIEFTSTTSTTVGASAAVDANATQTVTSAEMEIKNCVFRGRLYVYDNFENKGAMTYNIHDNVFDGANYSGDSNAYSIFAQCRGGNELIIKNNNISGFARGINIDHANIKATIDGNTISVTDTGRSCIQLSSLTTADIKGNTLNLTGGNAITLHEKLLKLTTAPEVSITDNTITGTGYLIYDDAAANNKSFTSDKLKLTYSSNTVPSTVDTTKGVKGSKTTALTGYVAAVAQGKDDITGKVAQVGTEYYTTLTEAFAALNETNHTLTLIDGSKWDAATPVYWKTNGEWTAVAKLTDALTAAYKAGPSDEITIVCRPGADVGEMTHGHVADNLTIYGNDAYLSDGECDLEVDTYQFSRNTGAQADDGAYLEKDITITAYELDNLGVWGERHTKHMINIVLTDCDGTNANVNQRVYISGNNGVNNIILKGCDFDSSSVCAVYSNADGYIVVDGCTFGSVAEPININHKASDRVTVEVKESTFNGCGSTADSDKQFAAPIRFVNSGSGTMSANVSDCTITGTKGTNGDILLGDGRDGKDSNDVTLTVSGTAANVQAQQPGYYAADGAVAEAGNVSKTAVKKSAEATTITNKAEVFVVAKIGDNEYSTLAAAVAAAKDGDTIKLVKDCSGDGIVFTTNKFNSSGLTIDFNNCTYTISGTLVGSRKTETLGFQLLKDNKITLKNGTITNDLNCKAGKSTPTWTEKYPSIILQNYCDLTLDNMAVTPVGGTPYTMSNNCGNVEIKDTKINTVSNGVAFDVYGGFQDYSDVTVTVTGSSEINGKIEVARDSGTQNKNTLAINGGTINGALVFKDHKNTTITISGGNFSQSVNKKYLDSSLNAELKRASGETPYSYYTSVAAATAAAQPGDTVTDLSAAVGEETATVTLNYNGGGTNTTITVKKNSSITLPTPKRSGYTFNGWYTEPVGGSRITTATVFTGDTTIYAQWTAKSSSASPTAPTLPMTGGPALQKHLGTLLVAGILVTLVVVAAV
mgnify:CR=1 FL=1